MCFLRGTRGSKSVHEEVKDDFWSGKTSISENVVNVTGVRKVLCGDHQSIV